MKYTLIAMMMGLAGVATAGQKLVPVAPATAPAPAPAWGVELAGTYGWGLGKYMKSEAITKKNHMNQVGGDITGVYNLDENNAVTLRFGYTYGGDKFGMTYEPEANELYDINSHIKERLHTFTLMPGYRYTVALDDKWSVYGGVNVGVAAVSSKLEVTHHVDRRSDLTASAHKSAWGFAWSVEAGARYAVTETVDVFAAVSYTGNTARPNIKYDGVSVGRVRTQQTLGVRAGVGIKF